jgi:hypothetical protein
MLVGIAYHITFPLPTIKKKRETMNQSNDATSMRR